MLRHHSIFQYSFSLVCFFQAINVTAQFPSSDGAETISEVIEEAVSLDEEEPDQLDLVAELTYFLDHPLDLNSATAEDLRQLGYLTEFQVFSLINYIHEQGELLSLFELQLVYGFDQQLISKLLPFVCLQPIHNGPDNGSKTKKKFSQVLIFRSGFNNKHKDKFIPDESGNKDFEGANRAIMLKYQASVSSFNFGLTAEQDAGESFTSHDNRFRPDFTSGFLEYNSKTFVKKIIVGDYKVTWGQGLILGGFGIRKGSLVLLSPQATGLKKYSSTAENNFFRGAAASLGRGNLSLDILVSNLKIDATLHKPVDDSTLAGYFNSPDLSGLHRNIKENEKKNTVGIKSFGGHAQINKGNITAGISYMNYNYDQNWIRNTSAYTNEFFPGNSHIHNLGADFKASLGKIAFFSELALDTKVRLAVLSGFLTELHPLVRLSMIYRNYNPGYLGLKSSGFGESQGTRNEEGFYLGLQVYPFKYLKLDIYADRYSFPFLRYNSTSPYSGNDYLLNLGCFPRKEFTINMRFRYEKNQNRSNMIETGIDRMQTAQKAGYRIELLYVLNKNMKLKSRMEFSYFRDAQKPMTKGFYTGHDINLQTPSGKYKLWFRYAIYDIPEWENRIYAYENDVLYSFSVPAFNAKGARFIIMGKTELFPGLELSVRFALSQLQGQSTTGNGNGGANNNSSAEGTLQLRFKL